MPLEYGIATLLNEQATAVRFDGSDLMPGEVGAGSFWKGMTDWVSGAADLDTVLKQIDDSWPKKFIAFEYDRAASPNRAGSPAFYFCPGSFLSGLF